jgi:hypothetical protein
MSLSKLRIAAGCGAELLTLVVLAGFHPDVSYSQTSDDPRIMQGLAIAPVTLNLTGRDRNMVGLGSYLVNAVAGCNDCHTNPSYTTSGNPFQGQAKKVNTAGYLSGGMAFGPFISRNITPDYTGRTNGETVDDFLAIMKTGVDPEKIHPAISPLLQVMPWPTYQSMMDSELRAMYEYLSAIPCLEGGPNAPSNRCTSRPTPPGITISPRVLTTSSKTLALDASGSTAADGGPLRFVWENVLGGPYVTFSDANSPMPTVTFTGGPGLYVLMLSAIDQAGVAGSMFVKITYTGT